jgi:uncharacterized protein (DUF1501 family)
VVTGEFGRTPRIGQISQNAITQKSGRDHWPHAFSVLLAGGGMPGGHVFGRTDRQAAFVDDRAVTPADLAATILAYLGVYRTATYHDEVQQVTRHVCESKPIRFP